MTLREYLSIPYLLVIEAIYDPDEGWIRRAAYPELPDCKVELFSPLEAIDQLEKLKIEIICTRLNNGELIPTTKQPLANTIQELELEKWGCEQFIEFLDLNEEQLVGNVIQ